MSLLHLIQRRGSPPAQTDLEPSEGPTLHERLLREGMVIRHSYKDYGKSDKNQPASKISASSTI